jgi:hypothetical protein
LGEVAFRDAPSPHSFLLDFAILNQPDPLAFDERPNQSV